MKQDITNNPKGVYKSMYVVYDEDDLPIFVGGINEVSSWLDITCEHVRVACCKEYKKVKGRYSIFNVGRYDDYTSIEWQYI